MLAVVQHQQTVLLAEGPDQQLLLRQPGLGAQAQRLGDGGGHPVAVQHGGQLADPHAVGETAGQVVSRG